jgi:multidrug efflux system outer membrane protein
MNKQAGKCRPAKLLQRRPDIRIAERTLTAFDLGRVYARMKAADAHAERDLANYEKTVLLALEDTENALVEYGRLQTRRDFFRLSVTAGEKAARLARLRYQDGVSDFLAVLDAERRLLETQDKLAQTETDTATALVAVYKALGGGWEWETSAGETSHGENQGVAAEARPRGASLN